MPYIQTWADPDKNPKLESHSELPVGYEEMENNWGYKKAIKKMDQDTLNTLKGKPFEYHYCKGDVLQDLPSCGWVEGLPNEYDVNTLGPLSGRQGTEYYCAKCGASIGFTGCYS